MARMAAARGFGLLLVLGIALGSVAERASAFEAFDGRLQVHGFFEQQVRGLGRDFDFNDDFDLAQWYHVLNVEIEYEIAPDGFGPFDLLSSFVRLEGRYDCVWSRGCGMLRSANTFGDRSDQLPKRLNDGRRTGFSAQLPDGDTRPYGGIPRVVPPDLFPFPQNNNTGLEVQYRDTEFGSRRNPVPFFGVPGIETLFGGRGVDGLLNSYGFRFPDADNDGIPESVPMGPNGPQYLASGGLLAADIDRDGVPDDLYRADRFAGGDGIPDVNLFDDAAAFIFDPFDDCVFALRRIKGYNNGRFRQTLGPWNPGCKIDNLGSLDRKPNPFNPSDPNEVVLGPGGAGSTELAFRSAPLFNADGTVRSGVGLAPGTRPTPSDARGIYIPSRGLQALIDKDEFDSFDQNFRQAELEWNRGASQQDEKELKEAYLDLEMFDSRLWIRAGKQSIVWGKTELFRTTDQFNPQDVALATLPSLEESRIALWAVRGVWSFYEIGPLEDVRFELAFNYDQFEPADLGRCGEPFTPNPVCNKTFGLFAHGFAGLAVAGEVRPPDAWNAFKGIEYGARLEWRWGRFSFQLADFYGYNDFPYQDRITSYARNVDPLTGRPRISGSNEPCTDGTQEACLNRISAANPDGLYYTPGGSGFLANDARYGGAFPGGPTDLADPVDRVAGVNAARVRSLELHPSNTQLFTMICSTSIGFSNLDPNVCAQSVLNSQVYPAAAPIAPLTQIIATLLRGGAFGKNVYAGLILVNPATNAAWGGIDLNMSGGVDTADLPLVHLVDEGRIGPDTDGGPPAVTPGYFLGGLAGISLDEMLSDEQEALLGCGPFYGTSCDLHGVDLLNAEGSAVVQSWPGFEGTFGDWSTFFVEDASGLPAMFDPLAPETIAQPGTAGFDGGTPCARFFGGELVILPGCRGPADASYDPAVDGTPPHLAPPDPMSPGDFQYHPFTGQPFASELAAASWNALMGFTALSFTDDIDNDDIPDRRDPTIGTTPNADASNLAELAVDEFDNGMGLPAGFFDATMIDLDMDGLTAADGDDGDVAELRRRRATYGPWRETGCSFKKPNFCSNIRAIYSVTGVQRNLVRAGGNGRFGRRDFTWHGGGEVALRYERRNVLGLSLDFAEDVTKSNWGAEFTWIEGLRFTDNDLLDGVNKADTFNLTISVDRPTFVNFLNANRTFFFNSQWFFQYVDGYTKGFTGGGPLNVLATFTIQTGYSQDRLLPSITWVYDFQSNSGGALPQISYRFTENFSATVGANFFWGRWDERDMPIAPISLDNRVGRNAYKVFEENGLSVVRDREELFLRLRYTF